MKQHHIFLFLALGFFWLSLCPLATASDIQVSTQVNQQDIYVGQPFLFTISIQGATAISQPNLMTFAGFQTKFLGQNQNSSITIRNGSKTSIKDIELNYQLIASAGTSAIPAITLIADGNKYTTTKQQLNLKQPVVHDDFKLEIQLSKNTAYVGEPLLMTTTWLIGQKAQGGGFSLPIQQDPRFIVQKREDLLPLDKGQLIRIELAGEVIVAKQYQKKVGDREFMAITFFQTLIPQTAGEILLPQATLAISALSGYESPTARRDYFGRVNKQQREIYQTIVIPANPVTLKVLPLPQDNVPQAFNGLVGQYTIQASATPTTVNVGDPISLELIISGTSAASCSMPKLPLDHFKISTEPPRHTATEESATFTTTIRARSTTPKEIPAITLAFFNVETGHYETAQTKPIALTVRPTRIITAQDALGGETIIPQESAPRSEMKQGIHYNYSDIQSSASVTTTSLFWWFGLASPPLLFLLVVLLSREVDPTVTDRRKRKKRALGQLKKDLNKLSPFEAWLIFLGNELNREPRSITSQDILPHIHQQPELHKQIRDLFQIGEASQYGGGSQNIDQQGLLATATKLHKVLK